MIILWSLLLTVATSAHKVVESTEDIGPEAFANVTTLYPVANQNTKNNTFNENTTKDNTETEKSEKKEDKSKTEATSWKIEAAYAESMLDKDKATTAAPKEEPKNETKEFRPSQHLGNFLGDDVAPTRVKFDSFTPVIKKPASGFVSSKEEYRFNNKIPKELLHTHIEYPYKLKSSIFTRAKDSWRPDLHKPWPTGTPGLEGLGDRPGKGCCSGNSGIDSFEKPGKSNQGNPGYGGFGDQRGQWGAASLGDIGDRPKGWGLDSQSKPTVASLVNVPAGGMYKFPDPFKEKPGSHGEDFGLEFNNDAKESAVKKQENPWEGILRMLTAFIPVGLIISALTPSIITIENTAPDNSYASNVYRRTDTDLAALPAISERCRRRLLCELHNEKNYSTGQNSPSHPRKWKQCYRIRCEDTAALTRTLAWLLERQPNRQHNAFY